MTRVKKHITGKFQFVLIALVWLLIFAIPLLFVERDSGINWKHVNKIWIETSIVFILFLLNRYVLLPYLFFKEKRFVYVVSVIGVILLFTISLFVMGTPKKEMRQSPPPHKVEGHRPPPNMPRHPRPNKQPIPRYANFFVMSILIIGFDTGLVFYMKWVTSERNKIQLEKESVENKMAFLQNQISPHFFMNTLNNIHALVDLNTEEAKEAIIRLSKMMSYMLYESQSDKVSLQREMEFVQSYVELMKLRFTEDVDIKLDISSELPNISIPPLLTISYIENAFKHGISYEKNSFVHIKFEFDLYKLKFNISNYDHSKAEKIVHSGIGMENTKSRLDLIYNTNYDLVINKNSDNIFEVTLNIPV